MILFLVAMIFVSCWLRAPFPAAFFIICIVMTLPDTPAPTEMQKTLLWWRKRRERQS
jgi:hypothetical protein